MPNVGSLATGIALALIGVMVGYILFNSLFTPTNTSATTINETLYTAGYTTEGDLTIQAWQFYLLAVPLTLLGGGIWMIVKAFKSA